jgi:capsular polysaccharide biosynthesis protein
LELTRYVRLLRRRLWMIVALPIVAAVAAGIVSLTLPPVYEAHTALLVWPNSIGPTDAASLNPDQISKTYASLLKQPPLLQRVADDVGISTRPEDMAGQITVTPQAGTTILDVTVSNTNPARARDIAKALVEELDIELKDIKAHNAGSVNARLSDVLVVVSSATLPDRPVASIKTLNVAFAFVTGLVLALGIAFLEYRGTHGRDIPSREHR